MLNETQEIFVGGGYQQSTPGAKVAKMAQGAVGLVLLSKQREKLAGVANIGVGIDGGVVNSNSARQHGLIMRVYAYEEHSDEAMLLVERELAVLEAKATRTKFDQVDIEWLKLQKRIHGVPINFACGAVVAKEGIPNAAAYEVGIIGAGARFGVGQTRIKAVLGDAASVITSAVEGLSKERINEFHHALAQTVRKGHRAAWAEGDFGNESEVELFWRGCVRTIRARFTVFKDTYLSLMKKFITSPPTVSPMGTMEDLDDCVCDAVNRPRTFQGKRFWVSEVSRNVFSISGAR